MMMKYNANASTTPYRDDTTPSEPILNRRDIRSAAGHSVVSKL